VEHRIVKPKEKLLKSRDVAWILDWSPDDVNVLARKGKLKAFKQGRKWRFREADVMTYKKSTTQPGRRAAKP
jgi:excisionase family DNA binding protein